MYQPGLQALAFTAILAASASAQFTNSTGNSSTPAGSAVLDPANIQNASAVDGQAAAGAAAGQAASLTSAYHAPGLEAVANLLQGQRQFHQLLHRQNSHQWCPSQDRLLQRHRYATLVLFVLAND